MYAPAMWFRQERSESTASGFMRPEALVIALYVRDVLGLAPVPLGAVPERLAPAVRTVIGGSYGPAVARQWNEWWGDVLRYTVSAAGRAPVDYYGPLFGREDLREAAEPLLRDGHRWFIANRKPWEHVRPEDFPPSVAERIATEVLGRRRRRLLGNLMFLTLPLEGQSGRAVGRGAWLLSDALIADLPALEAWLRGQAQALL